MYGTQALTRDDYATLFEMPEATTPAAGRPVVRWDVAGVSSSPAPAIQRPGTPLAAIQGYLTMMRNNPRIVGDPALTMLLGGLERGIEQVGSLVSEMLGSATMPPGLEEAGTRLI
jgi:hypothetical protein